MTKVAAMTLYGSAINARMIAYMKGLIYGVLLSTASFGLLGAYVALYGDAAIVHDDLKFLVGALKWAAYTLGLAGLLIAIHGVLTEGES